MFSQRSRCAGQYDGAVQRSVPDWNTAAHPGQFTAGADRAAEQPERHGGWCRARWCVDSITSQNQALGVNVGYAQLVKSLNTWCDFHRHPLTECLLSQFSQFRKHLLHELRAAVPPHHFPVPGRCTFPAGAVEWGKHNAQVSVIFISLGYYEFFSFINFSFYLNFCLFCLFIYFVIL